jgi:hypothetical protein
MNAKKNGYKKDIMDSPILITGCARSGTSMVAGSINKCGAFGGDMSGPNKYNKKGMFENAVMRNSIMKPYLSSMKCDPKGQYPLPNINKLKPQPMWKKKVETIFKKQGYKNGDWMYKGAKICLFWPVWNEAFPDAKWIIVRRKKEDIVNSCLKTSFMNAFSKSQNQKAVNVKNEKEGWEWWVDQHLKRFDEMKKAGLKIFEIWPEKMVEGDYTELYEAIKWLDLKWNSDILTFVDNKLWHTRINKDK